jgi:peptidoglycan/LPS O-acetylase OafA/YrhL
MQYKPAIDGLRALAVVSVLLFHANAPFLPGGYIGVDVFFVISGYLITTLICQEYGAGRFTLTGFYVRRIRRIFPALALVLLSTTAVSMTIMLPPDLIRFGSSVVASVLFYSNFYFWAQKSNYLRDGLEFEPLLHTWSLAIEEQFYILFPLFMGLALPRFKRLDLILIAGAAASFALSVYLTARHPVAAFYISPSRAWELLLGGWLAISGVKDRAPRRVILWLQLAGLVMIGAAAVCFDRLTRFPGFAALIPCVGTALLVAWCDDKSRMMAALSHPVLVWLGLISYPLYLWHWTLLVVGRLVLLREPSALEIAFIYLLAVVLAAATWHYLEKPIRARKGQGSTAGVFAGAATVACVTVAIGWWAPRAAEAVWGTSATDVARLLAAAKDYAPALGSCHNWDRKQPERLSHCTMGAQDRLEFDFVLWGDSHAGAVAMAVDGAARDLGKKGLQLTSDDCLPFLRTRVILNRQATDCEARNEASFELMRQLGIHRVMLAGAWVQYAGDYNKVLQPSGVSTTAEDNVAAFRQGFRQTIDILRAAGIDVVVVGPVPQIGWNVPSRLATMTWRKKPLPDGPSLDDFMKSERKIMPLLKELERDHVNVMYPHERLCAVTCLIHLNGEVLYSDDEHLSTRGADLLRPMFISQLAR